MPPKKENSGCGCSSIPISFLIIVLGVGYWSLTHLNDLGIKKFLPDAISKLLPNRQTPPAQQPTASIATAPIVIPTPSQRVAVIQSPSQQSLPTGISQPKSPVPLPKSPVKSLSQSRWEKKAIRGIYLSRYQVTNNASEQMIRDRVRYYRKQGMNTIIHGVWGNGCTMYNSQVMQQTFGYKSCPNQFQDQWLDWLIDEAHQQGMQVHAYFEKGIKIDKNSPIFDLAISKRWIVPGVDKTYAGIDHYVLDVEIPEVANLFKKISVEFVRKYPTIDAVQWDDYLGYHAALPGKIDRTARLTSFVRQLRSGIKQANPAVSFDLCHHNPYWGKRYFAADWQNWQIDRVFIQVYNDANFRQELEYAKNYAGVAISEKQLHRLKELVSNPKIKGVLVFPYAGKPEEAASLVKKTLQ
ncbi:family 10 glycosylhydrolase [Leptolyngbyaceae cyanobacterium UHCC 1019]